LNSSHVIPAYLRLLGLRVMEATSACKEDPPMNLLQSTAIEDIKHFLVNADRCWSLIIIPNSRKGLLGSPSASTRSLVTRDLARKNTRRGQLNNSVEWLKQCLARIEYTYDSESVRSVWLLNSLGSKTRFGLPNRSRKGP